MPKSYLAIRATDDASLNQTFNTYIVEVLVVILTYTTKIVHSRVTYLIV